MKNKDILTFLDFDNIGLNSLFVKLKTIILLSRLNNEYLKSVSYRLSSSGKGYHVKLLLTIPACIPDLVSISVFKLGFRFALGDCTGRLSNDCLRIKQNKRHNLSFHNDVVFDFKNGKALGDWVLYYEKGDEF